MAGTCTNYDNTATITETGQTASAKSNVCVGKDLTVTKTAAGTFDRTYLWTISKAVDKTAVKIAEGGTATFNYTVKVSPDRASPTAAGRSAARSPSANPNDWEAITLTSLSDAVDNGGTCTVDAGPYTSCPRAARSTCTTPALPYGSSAQRQEHRHRHLGQGRLLHAHRLRLRHRGLHADAGSASTNKTIHVTDTLRRRPSAPSPRTDASRSPTATFTYTVQLRRASAGTCTNYTNTATITETEQSDSTDGHRLRRQGPHRHQDRRRHLRPRPTCGRSTRTSTRPGQASPRAAPPPSTTPSTSTQTGFTDSGWTLGGKITITNPNDWEAITLTSLTDAVDNGGTCTVDRGPVRRAQERLARRQLHLLVRHRAGSYSGTNTATATWDKAAYFTPTGSATGDATASP